MSKPSQPTAILSPQTRRDALQALVHKGNPFRQQFARNSDDPVCSIYHVDGIFASERDILQELVETYRGEPDRQTTVLPLLGARGAGKTHLLHNLKHRPGVPPQLFVTPGTFRIDAAGPDSSFLEYLLYQFINVLLAGGEQRGVRPLVYVGEHLTRAALVEALESGTTSVSGSRRWSLVGRTQDHRRLAERLRMEPRPCVTLVDECQWSREQAAELAIRFLSQRESRDLKGEFRKRIATEFIRATLLGDEVGLGDFLTDGFAEVKFVVKPTRTQLTMSLLQALVELIVGSGIPVAAAFDQLEELLYGQTEAEIRRASDAFFGGLVQLMSQVSGLCVLLFVEEGLWNRIVPPLPSHILDRIHEPIHLPTKGTVRTVRLHTPTADQLTSVVAQRVRKTLADFPRLAELPAEFPFERSYLEKLAEKETVLRLMLQGCCAKLDDMMSNLDSSPLGESVRTTASTTEGVLDGDTESLWEDLRERWDQEVRSSERKLKPVGALAAATLEIQGGLCRWLQICKQLGVEQDDWRLEHVIEHVQTGDHPTYGSLTLLEWATSTNERQTVAIGLWLGRGVGKPKDLETKLCVFDGDSKVDHLILFRPADDSRVSGRSQTVWDEALGRGMSLRLETVDLNALARLHAFPRWLQQLQDTFGADAIPEHAYVFLAEQTEDVMIRLGLPTETSSEAA
jgi:hypothetical protein